MPGRDEPRNKGHHGACNHGWHQSLWFLVGLWLFWKLRPSLGGWLVGLLVDFGRLLRRLTSCFLTASADEVHLLYERQCRRRPLLRANRREGCQPRVCRSASWSIQPWRRVLQQTQQISYLPLSSVLASLVDHDHSQGYQLLCSLDVLRQEAICDMGHHPLNQSQLSLGLITSLLLEVTGEKRPALEILNSKPGAKHR